jgi:hypothetical protein
MKLIIQIDASVTQEKLDEAARVIAKKFNLKNVSFTPVVIPKTKRLVKL